MFNKSDLASLARRKKFNENGFVSNSATPAQRECLENLGVKVTGPLSRSDAHRLIFQAIHARRRSRATEKQERFLRKHGQWRDGLTMEQAHALIGNIIQEDRAQEETEPSQ